MFKAPNDYRIRQGQLASDDTYGNNGAFYLGWVRKGRSSKTGVLCIASDGSGWEHVSVSLNKPRCPCWDEMCKAKEVFWDPDDSVIQIHPPESEYVNHHPFTLHLWRKAGTNEFYEAPPNWMVGPQP